MINLDDLKKASEIFFYFTSPFVALLVGYWSRPSKKSTTKKIPRRTPKHRG